MESLIEDVRALTNMRERGGRIRRIDEREILVLDVGEWPERVAFALRERHPTVACCVEACPDSLSRFAIRITLRESGPVLYTACIVAAICTVTAYFLGVELHSFTRL